MSEKDAMFQSGSLVATGTNLPLSGVNALTDGIAMIYIQGTTQNPAVAYAYAGIGTTIQSNPTWFNTTGGALGQSSAPELFMDSFSNSVSIPIPAGSTWYFYGSNVASNQQDVEISVYWFPMVSSGNGDPITYEVLGPDTDSIMPLPPSPVPLLRENIEARSAHAASFIEQLETAFDKTIDPHAKRELASLLAKL